MANRFWVLGTGTWDASDTTHWAASSGAGSGGQSVPGVGDTVIFDGSSGGGTVTVNTNPSVISLNLSAYTGTLDFSVNNNSLNVSSSISNTTNAAGTFKMGSGTFTITSNSAGTLFNWTNTTMTVQAGTSTIVITGTLSGTSPRTIALGTTATWNNLTISANTGGASHSLSVASIIGGTLTVNGPNSLQLVANQTIASLVLAGSNNNIVSLEPNTVDAVKTITLTNVSNTNTWSAIRAITFAGAAFSATNSFDLGSNTLNGGSILTPSGGGAGIIGG